jgi:hypothetical protein
VSGCEDHIIVGQLGGKVGLRYVAPRGIPASGDRVEIVDAAVQGLPALLSVAVGSLLVVLASGSGCVHKPGLAHRAIGGDERRHGVSCAVHGRHRDLGVDGRAGATDGRLRMTCRAGVCVVPRSQPDPALDRPRYRVDLLEAVKRGLEHGQSGRVEPRQWPSRPCWPAAHSRVVRLLARRIAGKISRR